MTQKLTVPSTLKVARDRENTFLIWFPRFRALASDTILDRATGRPPVEMMMSRE